MRVAEYGRFVFPADAATARQYVERNLLSLHGRALRLRAVAGLVRVPARLRDEQDLEPVRLAISAAPVADAEWLLLRDYSESSRRRSVVFLFRSGSAAPLFVVKVRQRGAEGSSLRLEADILNGVSARLPPSLRATTPQVEEFASDEAHEVLVMSAVAGRSLSISMQRSLRPRRRHARHLAAAGRWLGAFQAATRDGARPAGHGDFWSRNILFEESDRVSGVVDWEHGAISDADPWSDVFTLAIDYAVAAPLWRRRDRVAEFQRAFFGSGTTADAIRTYFSHYFAAGGVVPNSRELAFLFQRHVRERHPDLATATRGGVPAALADVL